MQGMDGGPWTDLGTLGWFVGVWVVMMAAMMFPSVAPTVALYSKMTKARSPLAPLVFTSGYLVVWGAVGALAFAVAATAVAAGRRARLGPRGTLDRRRDAARRGRLRADAAEGRLPRQVPEPARLSARRRGATACGAQLEMGARHGAWCIGCCWALMASLFALGVMSLAWMAVVAGLIAFEKLMPWRRAAT